MEYLIIFIAGLVFGYVAAKFTTAKTPTTAPLYPAPIMATELAAPPIQPKYVYDPRKRHPVRQLAWLAVIVITASSAWAGGQVSVTKYGTGTPLVLRGGDGINITPAGTVSATGVSSAFANYTSTHRLTVADITDSTSTTSSTTAASATAVKAVQDGKLSKEGGSYHLNRNTTASSDFIIHGGDNTYNPAFNVKITQPVQGAYYTNNSGYPNQMTFGGSQVLSAPAGSGTYVAFRGYSSAAGNTYAPGANNDQAIQFFTESADVNRDYAYPYNQVLLRAQQWSGENRFRHFTIYSSDSGFDFTGNRWNIPYGVDYILPNYQSIQGIRYDGSPFDSSDRVYTWLDIDDKLNSNTATTGGSTIHPIIQLADRVQDLPAGCSSGNDLERGLCGSSPSSGGNRQSGFLEFQAGTWTLSSTAAGAQNIPATEYSTKTDILTANTTTIIAKSNLALDTGKTLTLPITGATQCLQVDTSGVVSGTAANCGAASPGSQTANTVYAAPSGSAGTPSYRAITLLDIQPAMTAGTAVYSATDGAKYIKNTYSIWPKAAGNVNALAYNAFNVGTATVSANYAAAYYNQYNESNFVSGVGDNMTGGMIGSYNLTRNQSIKTMATLIGTQQNLSTANASTGGTVTDAIAYSANFGSAASGQGTITNGYGFYMPTKVGAGPITNYYGVYIQDAAASNYFAGSVTSGSAITATTITATANTDHTIGTAAPSTTGNLAVDASAKGKYEFAPTGTTTQTVAISGNPASGKVRYVSIQIDTAAAGVTTLAWPTVDSAFGWTGTAGFSGALTASKRYKYVCEVGATKAECSIVGEGY